MQTWTIPQKAFKFTVARNERTVKVIARAGDWILHESPTSLFDGDLRISHVTLGRYLPCRNANRRLLMKLQFLKWPKDKLAIKELINSK
jgi:hypothetical protein